MTRGKHIAVNALNLRPGGGLKVAEALVSGLLPQEVTARVTVLWSDAESGAHLRRVFGSDPRVSLVQPTRQVSNLKVFIWQMTKLAGFLRGQGADVVIGLNHHFPSGSVPQITYHVNVTRFERERGPVTSIAEVADRLRDWRAKRALTASQINVFESRYLLDLATTKASAIHNPQMIHIGREQAKAAAPHPDTIQPHLLALTSPQPHKDNPTLIRALAELIRVRPDVAWRLKIAGGTRPEVFDDLRTLASELGVADKIDWLGFQPHDTLATIGAQCLCLLSASRVESFCMVAVEAMSWGCPPIVADISSMPESVGNAGVLVPPGDAAAFAHAALALWDDPSERDALVTKGDAHVASLTWTRSGAAFSQLITALDSKDHQ